MLATMYSALFPKILTSPAFSRNTARWLSASWLTNTISRLQQCTGLPFRLTMHLVYPKTLVLKLEINVLGRYRVDRLAPKRDIPTYVVAGTIVHNVNSGHVAAFLLKHSSIPTVGSNFTMISLDIWPLGKSSFWAYATEIGSRDTTSIQSGSWWRNTFHTSTPRDW